MLIKQLPANNQWELYFLSLRRRTPLGCPANELPERHTYLSIFETHNNSVSVPKVHVVFQSAPQVSVRAQSASAGSHEYSSSPRVLTYLKPVHIVSGPPACLSTDLCRSLISRNRIRRRRVTRLKLCPPRAQQVSSRKSKTLNGCRVVSARVHSKQNRT